MSNAALGQQIVSVWVGNLASFRCVSRIPVQHEMRRLDGLESPRALCAGGGVARHLVLHHQRDASLASLVSCLEKLGVNRPAMGSLILQAPKVEAPHPIGTEGFRQFDGALKHLVLLRKSVVGIELVALGTELGDWGARPIHLEEWAGDIGDAQTKALENATRLLHLLRIEP